MTSLNADNALEEYLTEYSHALLSNRIIERDAEQQREFEQQMRELVQKITQLVGRPVSNLELLTMLTRYPRVMA